MVLNKIDEVSSSAKKVLSDVSGLLSSKNYATIATWRKDLQFDTIWRITNQSETFSHTIVL